MVTPDWPWVFIRFAYRIVSPSSRAANVGQLAWGRKVLIYRSMTCHVDDCRGRARKQQQTSALQWVRSSVLVPHSQRRQCYWRTWVSAKEAHNLLKPNPVVQKWEMIASLFARRSSWRSIQHHYPCFRLQHHFYRHSTGNIPKLLLLELFFKHGFVMLPGCLFPRCDWILTIVRFIRINSTLPYFYSVHDRSKVASGFLLRYRPDICVLKISVNHLSRLSIVNKIQITWLREDNLLMMNRYCVRLNKYWRENSK